MELKDRSIFLDLKKKYGMERAVAKQQHPELFVDMDEDELYHFLILIDTNSVIVDAINCHMERDSSVESLCALCTMIVLQAHKLLDTVSDQYSEEDIQRIRQVISSNILMIKDRLSNY